MRRLFAAVVFVAFCTSFATAEDKKPGPMIGHMVYFKLKDNTPENRQKLVAACEKYLADHEGVVFFSAGVIGGATSRTSHEASADSRSVCGESVADPADGRCPTGCPSRSFGHEPEPEERAAPAGKDRRHRRQFPNAADPAR